MQAIRYGASFGTIDSDAQWWCAEQEQLKVALAGVYPDLPYCRILATATRQLGAITASDEAERELRAAFRALDERWTAAISHQQQA